MTRSRGALLKAVDELDVENNPALQRRDVTGDGVPETWCNVFLRLVLERLGLEIPPLLANDLYDWFPGAKGQLAGWRRCTPAVAAAKAESGIPSIGAWRNRTGKHGHVVLVVPALGGTGMHVAQAGARNWSNEPIEHSGLISSAYSFFTHP